MECPCNKNDPTYQCETCQEASDIRDSKLDIIVSVIVLVVAIALIVKIVIVLNAKLV